MKNVSPRASSQLRLNRPGSAFLCQSQVSIPWSASCCAVCGFCVCAFFFWGGDLTVWGPPSGWSAAGVHLPTAPSVRCSRTHAVMTCHVLNAVTRGPRAPRPASPPGGRGSVFVNSVFTATLRGITTWMMRIRCATVACGCCDFRNLRRNFRGLSGEAGVSLGM